MQVPDKRDRSQNLMTVCLRLHPCEPLRRSMVVIPRGIPRNEVTISLSEVTPLMRNVVSTCPRCRIVAKMMSELSIVAIAFGFIR